MEPVTPALLSPAYDANSFTLPDGPTYTATESLSVPRYRVFQKRQVEFGFSGTFKAICEDLDKIWADLNTQKLGAAAQKVGNLRDGITFAGHGRVTGLEVCGLFFNAPDEDPITYNHDAMKAKLLKWEEAGVAVDFFFRQAAARVNGFYERFTQSSPEAEQPLPPQP
jgi:hypothetical protein